MSIFRDLYLWAAARRYGPKRETLAYPKLQALLGNNRSMGSAKPTPANLRYFSRTVYARRAINAIKSPICALSWEVVPDVPGTAPKALRAQAETLARCLEMPNTADSFRSLLEQLIEDALVTGAGVAEIGTSPEEARPLWLWPVDATTVRPVVGWDGRPHSVRFVQSLGYTGASILSDVNARKIEARDMLYLRVNPASDSPYGFGPLEIAYDSINRQLGVGRYAANLASNAQPQNLIYVGQATMEEVLAFRNYWRNEVEGQGQTPILSNAIKPDVLKLHAGGDEALYLKWQQFLIREIATAFGLSPQNLGIEADVNRNTSEVAEDRDWDQAIKPMASLIESHLTRDVLARFGPFRFRFTGLDREDENATAKIYATYYQGNAITPNEQRARLGLPPLKSPWADLCWADVQIAMKGAQGAKQIDDNQLPQPAAQPAAGVTGDPENGS